MISFNITESTKRRNALRQKRYQEKERDKRIKESIAKKEKAAKRRQELREEQSKRQKVDR